MRYKNHIRGAASGMLLVLLVFAITPKRFLHDLVATHADNTKRTTHHHAFELSAAGYNCVCDNLVAESNFIASLLLFVTDIVKYNSHHSKRLLSFISAWRCFHKLRGPPICI